MPFAIDHHQLSAALSGQETTKTLDRGSISIGRAAQSDWVLQDPERILSGRHCTLHYQDGGYFLTDTSTNGVYLNDSEQRVGRNQMVRLKDGDHFVLGEYEIAVACYHRNRRTNSDPTGRADHRGRTDFRPDARRRHRGMGGDPTA